LYQPIFDEQLQVFQNPQVSLMTDSVELFCEHTGLVQMANLFRQMESQGCKDPLNTRFPVADASFLVSLDQAMESRRVLQHIVSCYRQCLSRSLRGAGGDSNGERVAIQACSPWALHVPTVLPLLAKIVKCLHELWDPKVYHSMPAGFDSIMAMTPHERNTLLGITDGDGGESEVITAQNAIQLSEEIAKYRNWLRLLRENTYLLLGFACNLKSFYSHPHFAQFLLQNIFGSVGALSNYHWKSLNHFFVRPLLTACPPEQLPMIYGNVLPHLIGFMSTRLNTHWQSIIERGAGLSERDMENAELDGEGGTLADEIIEQKCLRDLTRSWVDIWAQIYSGQTGKGDAKENDKLEFGATTPMVQYLWSNEPALALQLYQNLLLVMNWADTKACVSVAKIMMRILPHLAKDARWHAFLVNDMLIGALTALHDGYHEEGYDTLLTVVLETILALKPQNDQVDAVMSQCLPSFNDPETLKSFYQALMSEKSGQSQRKYLRSVLKPVLGKKAGQRFRRMDSSSQSALLKSMPEKMIGRREANERAKAIQEQLRQQQAQNHPSPDEGLLSLFNDAQ
jgi:hypothetical protein